MRLTAPVGFFLILALPMPATAQTTNSPTDRDQLVFADLSLGVVSAGFEQIFGDQLGVSVAFGLYGPWYVGRPVSIVGVAAELRLFWYPFGTESTLAPYLSPGFRLGTVSADDEGRSLSGPAFGPRLTVGANVRFGHFFFRLGAGIQHHNVDLEPRASGEDLDIHEFYPAVDIYLGAAL